MKTTRQLFANNRRWARQKVRDNPAFFTTLVRRQTPRYLWIGCSDSRVPANEIVGLQPGDLFVHRNVANLVAPADTNCLCVLQYAVEILRIEHVIVCGHYGCGGITEALAGRRRGPTREWLQPVRDLLDRHRDELAAISDPSQRQRRLCELNVETQVRAMARIPLVRDAWDRGQPLRLHGWIYDIRDGLLHNLRSCDRIARAGCPPPKDGAGQGVASRTR